MRMKTASEMETRRSIFKSALRFYGEDGLRQVKMHFDKYDKILMSCKNETERDHIKRIAIIELHQLMQFKDGLNINGTDIIPPLE